MSFQNTLPLIDICDDLESGFNAIILDLTRLNGGNVVLSRISQDIESVLTGKCYQLAALRPVNLKTVSCRSCEAFQELYLFRIDFNSANQSSSLPVKQSNTTLSLNTEKNTAS